MERNYFFTTYPKTKYHLTESLGISLFTNIQLLDYYLYSSSEQPAEIMEMSKRLPKVVKEDLHILRTVFAHGVILRNYYIQYGNIEEEWDAFIRWWEELSEHQVLNLIIYGIRESMDYYVNHMPTIPAVEETMKGVRLEKEQLKERNNRELAIKAVLQSWSVHNLEEILPIYLDVNAIKKRILRLIIGFWESCYQEVWEKKWNKIAGWKIQHLSLLTKVYGTNEEAIYTITGLYPDTKETPIINRANELTFIPVPNMGRLMTYVEEENHLYLMFEPNLTEQEQTEVDKTIENTFSALEGLGDFTRLQIISLLANHGEMYAQQIVTELHLKQSTVSRHLNQLHQANLVQVRQDGNTKYFSINKEQIRNVINFLKPLLN